MNDTTTLQFGLDGYGVLDVEDIGDDAVRVVIEPLDSESACPGCGVMSGRVKDRPLRRIKDLPASGRRVELWCRQRRLACLERVCPRRSFTLSTGEVPARARVTGRLRGKLADAIARSNLAVSDVAGEYGVSWPTAHRPPPTAHRPPGPDRMRRGGCRRRSRPGCWASTRPERGR